jgi:hypothetical protein
MQRCAALVVADADIGAAADEERRRLDPANAGGEMERRLAGRVAGINFGSSGSSVRELNTNASCCVLTS